MTPNETDDFLERSMDGIAAECLSRGLELPMKAVVNGTNGSVLALQWTENTKRTTFIGNDVSTGSVDPALTVIVTDHHEKTAIFQFDPDGKPRMTHLCGIEVSDPE